MKIHFRLPTGAVHPQAAAPITHAEPPYPDMDHTLPGFEFYMEFQSDLLLIVVGGQRNLEGRPWRDRGIFVINWKKDEVLLVRDLLIATLSGCLMLAKWIEYLRVARDRFPRQYLVSRL